MCWPIYYVANFNVLDKWYNYKFWVAVGILYPLQGFFNAIVYFRARIFQNLGGIQQRCHRFLQTQLERRRRQSRQQHQQQHKNDSAKTNDLDRLAEPVVSATSVQSSFTRNMPSPSV